MSPRLVIDGNDVYEIDEECECFKASIEEQMRMGKHMTEFLQCPVNDQEGERERRTPGTSGAPGAPEGLPGETR